MEWLIGSLGLAGGAIAALVLALKLRGANDELELLRVHYRLAQDDLRAAREAAADELRRRQEENRALRDSLEASTATLERLALDHPGLGRDLLRGVLVRATGNSDTVGDTHAPVPGAPTPAPTGSGR